MKEIVYRRESKMGEEKGKISWIIFVFFIKYIFKFFNFFYVVIYFFK